MMHLFFWIGFWRFNRVAIAPATEETNFCENSTYDSDQALKKNDLQELAKFVVNENGSHHNGQSISQELFVSNVHQVYSEDLSLFDSSAFYLAFADGRPVGSLKVSLWDGDTVLPIEKLFGIDCRFAPFFHNDVAVWHIGRLAISRANNPSGLSLLKQLLTLAIYSICRHPYDNVMVAECDRKLVRVLQLMGIKTRALGPGIEYLGSETIPIYATGEWLAAFLRQNEWVDAVRATAEEAQFMRSKLVQPRHLVAV